MRHPEIISTDDHQTGHINQRVAAQINLKQGHWATKLPGLRSYTVSRPGPDADGKQPPYYLIAVLTWDSLEAF
jgi:hypothetical protein